MIMFGIPLKCTKFVNTIQFILPKCIINIFKMLKLYFSNF